MLEMLVSMQLQLQIQEMTKGEEIGDDFSFAEPQLHNLPCLPLRRPQKIEGESETLPPNEHRSPSSYDSCAAQLESEGFVGVLNHTPITTTMAKSRFGEPKSKVLADLKLDEPNSVFEVLPKQPLVVYLCSAFIESSKNNDAWKVFDELTRRELKSFEAIAVVVDLGNVIYIYEKENNVKNEATAANLVVGCDIDGIESMMGFDPGGDPKVFDKCSYKKLLNIEELFLFRSCSNSPRNHSKSYKPRYFVEKVTSGFNVTDLHRSWLQVKATQSPPERNMGLENMCRRIWNLAWQKKWLFNMMHDWNLFSGNIMLVEYFWNKQPHEVIELLEQVSVLKMVEMNGVHVVVVVPTLADLYSFVKKKILDKYLEVLLLIDVGVVMPDIEENYQTYKADKTFDGMVDVIFSNVAQLDQRLQVEHFKLTELVAWELQQDHACGWTKKFDRPLPKPPPQFRYLSREDTTHSRGKYCYVNGRVRCGDLGEVELLPKMKLGVGKPLDWAVLIGLLSLFYFMFSAHCLGPYGGYSTLVYLT